ncbi:MAG: penicillin-binding protein 2 [Chitinispirillales bacterium]|jgi:penicillin-binding protein 2|nr:penicillin-binding protein 2 [Chitinispirillales bacterium]
MASVIGALPEKNSSERERKSIVLTFGVVFLFLILILRLFFIQIFEGDKNFAQSVDNQVIQEIIKAPRGFIYDRNGVILAQNRPSYSVGIIPVLVPKKYNIIEPLLKIKDRNGVALFDSTELVESISRIKRRSLSQFAVLQEDISFDYVSVISEHSSQLPGIIIETSMRRDYPVGMSCFHVIGYLGGIDPSQLDTLKFMGYEKSDFIGKAGIEKQYENILHGQDGLHYIERNAHGRRLRVAEEYPFKEPIGGSNVYLTIDANMQKITYESFEDTMKGAAVALDPRTGEVLCIVSVPSIDPNIFSLDTKLREGQWKKIVNDLMKPLNNRAVVGTYPPGSTFKPVAALAAVDSAHLDPNARFPKSCTGAFRIGSRVAKCWYHNGHGSLNLYDAIKVSCNVYFYQLGLRVGDKLINHYVDILGMGEKTGIDLPVESNGYKSGEEAYNERFAKRNWKWSEGLVLDLAIGQQQIFTPLQLAVMVGALGNGKERYKPYLLKEVVYADTEIVFRREISEEMYSLESIKPKSIEIVKRGMNNVVEEGGGTGRRARVEGIPVGGKSGTAQNPLGGDHALFIAAAPMDNPVIAVAVVVENVGGGGSKFAAPIVGNILNYYFDNTEEGQKIAAKYRKINKTEYK